MYQKEKKKSHSKYYFSFLSYKKNLQNLFEK